MRSPLNLVGTSIHMTQAMWNNRLGGTGAGIDSFYEYLLKAYILFGKSDFSSAILHVTLPGMHTAMQLCVGALDTPFCASKVASTKHFYGCCASLSSEFLPVQVCKTVACWLYRSWVCYKPEDVTPTLISPCGCLPPYLAKVHKMEGQPPTVTCAAGTVISSSNNATVHALLAL